MRKKGRASLVCVLLGLALSWPAVVAHADTTHPSARQQTRSVKRYAKRQRKAQKKVRKLQNKAVKSWKKRHHVA